MSDDAIPQEDGRMIAVRAAMQSVIDSGVKRIDDAAERAKGELNFQVTHLEITARAMASLRGDMMEAFLSNPDKFAVYGIEQFNPFGMQEDGHPFKITDLRMESDEGHTYGLDNSVRRPYVDLHAGERLLVMVLPPREVPS